MISLRRAGLLLSVLLVSLAAAGDYEPETMSMTAASLLPAEMLKGAHYSIADHVQVSGYMNYFMVNSDYGPFAVTGNRNLKRLLREIDAIAQLKAMTSAGVGTDAVVGVVTDTGKSVGALVTNPVGSVKNMGAGVSRFFKRTAKTTKDVGQQVSQKNSAAAEEQGDVNTDVQDADEQPGVSTSVANAFLGIGKAHRKIAEQLQVDPYSDNVVLQAELNRVAQISGTVGKLSKILMPIPSIVSTASSVSNLVWSLSPTDLLIQNQETLKKLGYDKKLIEQFFSNKFYTPTEQTILVAAAKSLDSVKGREILLRSASVIESTIEGDFMVWSVVFAQSYHERVRPIREFLDPTTGLLPIAITESGTGMVFAPLDQLLWTEGVDKALRDMAKAMDEHGGGKEHAVWVEGEISPLALERLSSSGWLAMATRWPSATGPTPIEPPSWWMRSASRGPMRLAADCRSTRIPGFVNWSARS